VLPTSRLCDLDNEMGRSGVSRSLYPSGRTCDSDDGGVLGEAFFYTVSVTCLSAPARAFLMVGGSLGVIFGDLLCICLPCSTALPENVRCVRPVFYRRDAPLRFTSLWSLQKNVRVWTPGLCMISDTQPFAWLGSRAAPLPSPRIMLFPPDSHSSTAVVC